MAAKVRKRPGFTGAARERRPAIWPYLVMPLIVVLVFYALYRVHQQPRHEPAATPAASGPPSTEPAPQ